MIRVFNVYYPLRTLVLLAGEALIVWFSFVLGTVLQHQDDSWLALNVDGGMCRTEVFRNRWVSTPLPQNT